MKSLARFFDRFEDRIRRRLSHFPIFYAFLGGIGIVLFWRGVWHTADAFMPYFLDSTGAWQPTTIFELLDGPVSILLSIILLLATGLFVSTFIGNEIIISGLRGEKKLDEKTEIEVRTETGAIGEIQAELKKISNRLEAIEKKITGKQ